MGQQSVDAFGCSGRESGEERSGERRNEQSGDVPRPTLDTTRPDPPVASLVRAIEGEVIPRLLLLRGLAGKPQQINVKDKGPSRWDVVEFGRLLLRVDPAEAAAYVQERREEGSSLQSIYLELIGPAARFLGAQWEADRCTFVDVTIGLGRLQQMLRSLGDDFRADFALEDRGRNRRAVIVAAPGEQHTFGLVMVSEFFRRAGWTVIGGPLWKQEDPLAIVADQRIDMIGISVSNSRCLNAAAVQIPLLRRASRNPDIQIMLGGRLFVENPELATHLGANATAIDGRRAATSADRLVSRSAQI